MSKTIEQVKQTEFELLMKLKKVFDELGVAVVLREEDVPVPILTTLHDNIGYQNNEVMGEFYFLPLYEEGQEFHYFSLVMTLDEEVPEERYEDFALATSMLNFHFPIGSFVIERKGGILAYKYTALLPVESDMESLVLQADGAIGTSMALVNDYVDVFMQLLNGEITLQQFELELPDISET